MTNVDLAERFVLLMVAGVLLLIISAHYLRLRIYEFQCARRVRRIARKFESL